MNTPGISVIICCYNATARLEKTLRALQLQQFTGTRPAWELIVVDNASTDGTAAEARRIWSSQPVVPLQVVQEPTPGLMHARKKGLATASFSLISFIDDDNRVEPYWVEKVWSTLSSDERIAACGGRCEGEFEEQMPDWFPRYENSFAVGRQMPQSGFIDETRGFLWGAGLSFRKSCWDELEAQGFKPLTLGREGDKITAGEDSELCYAFRLLGYKLYYRDDLWLKHHMPPGRMNLAYLEKMYLGFGQSQARLSAYRLLLEPGFQLRPWWYEWGAARKRILRLKRILKKEGPASGLISTRVQLAYDRGYAQQVWRDKSKIRDTIKSLRALMK